MAVDVEPVTPASGPDLSRIPVTAAISLIGVLLTALCLTTAKYLNHSVTTRALGVLATGLAMLAILGALFGQLRPSLRTTLPAALLTAVAVILATTAALIVVLRPDGPRSSSPRMTFALTQDQGVGLTLSVHVEIPRLSSRSMVDATLTGVGYDASQTTVLARTVVRPDDAFAQVLLRATTTEDFQNVVVAAQTDDRTCRAASPLTGSIQQIPDFTCRAAG
ncbi:hypothetical protein [Actinoplanes aureus]|uniref:Uncharacterized protein n=1 Tax=Actinoplanes aureus TaxID=2792083 RepID=A0A931CAI6_9ACTN|nr:hypothetical protein [Actinoplanes aureus]MBG0563856.1 hypothetical protein [Actinoplanes aureus]